MAEWWKWRIRGLNMRWFGSMKGGAGRSGGYGRAKSLRTPSFGPASYVYLVVSA